MKSARFRVFDEKTDILPLLKVSDIVLSDNSGAIFDALLADKPIVLFESGGEIFNEEVYLGSRGISGFSTYPESLEQKIKQDSAWALGPVIKSLKEIPRAISELKEKDAIFKENRKKVR